MTESVDSNSSTFKQKFSIDGQEIRTNVLSGITVALALVPEAIAFALLAGLTDVKIGLYAAFIVCLLTSVLGGRPGMISGATGALAVVMVSLVQSHGVEYLFATVVLMGILQLIAGGLRLGKFIRLVPYPVMLGFVNGLAVVIFLAQFELFKVGGEWLAETQLWTMGALIVLSLIIIYVALRLTKVIPAPLLAIIIVTLLVIFLDIDTRTVGDLGSIAGGLPSFSIPDVDYLSFKTLEIIFPYALILATIGLIESLLTLNLIDEMTDTGGQPNRECMGQGAANVVTGFFGGMGGCAMIGQSMININNGAYKRLSGVVAALALLSFILFASDIIEKIPLAVLIAVMFFVAERTFEWGSIRMFKNIPKEDYLVIVGVTLITVFTHNLAVAVVAGVIFAALVFAWQHAKEIHISSEQLDESLQVYQIKGTLFFASVSRFNRLFSPKDDPEEVVIDFMEARVIDQSAIVAIDNLAERYSRLGKTLHLRHLSEDCRKLLTKAQGMVEVNVVEDPHYHPADDRLG